MRPRSRSSIRLALSLSLVAGLAGCTALTNLDQYHRRAPTSAGFYDVEFSISGFTSHVAEHFEARLVDGTGIVQTRIVSEPLGGEAESFTLPAAVPISQTDLKVELYADHNGDGQFDLTPLPADHSWILPVSGFAPDPVDRVVRIPFAHNTTFQALGDDKTFGADALIHVVNVGGLVGKRLQLRVADASSKHLVGLYRVPALGKPAFDARIRGIIDPAPGTRYQLEATIDDGTPESGGLLTFRDLGVSGTSTGLELTFDPAAATKASDVLPPQEPN